MERQNNSPTVKSKAIARGRKFVPARVRDETKFHTAARRYIKGDRDWARNTMSDAMTREIAVRALGTSGAALDIGSSLGGFALAFAAMAPGGQHHAFEPVPASFETLRARAEKVPNLTVHNLAIGAESTTTSFMVGDDTGLSGFKTTQIMLDRTGSSGTEIQVEVKRLDDLDLPQASFAKIDVEGAELEVLRGGRDKLANDRPWIVFEHTDHARAYAPEGTSAALFDLSQELGYDVSTLDFSLGELPPLDKHTFVQSVDNRWFEYFVLQPK